MKLSQYFSLDEMTVSQEAARRGLDNMPSGPVLETLRRTAGGLDRVRRLLRKPVIVTSGYRSPTVNQAIGGSARSQHIKGEAADIICPSFGRPAAIAALLAGRLGEFGIDQLILEYGRWVHLSFVTQPRHMILTIDTSGTRPGLVA